MNSTKQRTHRTVTAELARGLEEIATATDDRLETLDGNLLTMGYNLRADIANEGRLLRQCCQERWDAQCETNGRLIRSHQAFVGRTFWQRLRWLVTGR